MELEVVGISYRLTVDGMREMQERLPLICTLEREPENIHDENAVKVVITEGEIFHLGYLARQTAAVFAPTMDEGTFPFEPSELLTDIDEESGRGTILLQRRPKRK
jgi:hypothetical protein